MSKFLEKPDLSNRDIRQRDIIPPQLLADSHVMIIGVGAIGRQVALQLAAIGVGKLTLVDFDTVGVENLACQGFRESDIGWPKVEAVADACMYLNSQIEVVYRFEKFRRNMEYPSKIFCCVDSIRTRQHIWDCVEGDVNFFCDTRMSAEVARVITAADSCGKNYYPQTLFASIDAYAGACTAKSTIYCANIAAGLAVASFRKFLTNIPIDADVTLNILTNELTVNAPLPKGG
jgi:sulfur carrier protein ThiS adenylyltransferase